MRAVIMIVVLMAVAVVAQNTVAPAAPVLPGEEYTPAIIGKAPAALKKPIIFNPAPVAGTPEADAPLTGAIPANLKKSVVTEHIYGGAVEFEKSRTPQGCRCRRQLPEKYRYDAKFKRTPKVVTPCGCPAAVNATNPEAALPPVIARLYPMRNVTVVNATAPCAAPTPVVTKIAPSYYPKRKGPKALAKAAALAAAPCAKNVTAAVPTTITPSFYPTRAQRRQRRKARKAKKAAKAAAKKKL